MTRDKVTRRKNKEVFFLPWKDISSLERMSVFMYNVCVLVLMCMLSTITPTPTPTPTSTTTC